MKSYFVLRVLLATLLFIAPLTPSFAVEQPEDMADRVGVDQNLGQQIDLNLKFTDQDGRIVQLGDLVRPPSPTIIVPVYYKCPRLCGFLLSGVTTLLNSIDLKLGKDFRVVTVSFDPTEDSSLAADRAATYRSKITENQNDVSNWNFLVGSNENVSKLMQQLGFRYYKDGPDFAHGAVIVVVTPTGEISQYFFGVEFVPFDLRLALVEASKGSIGTVLDQVLLFCFRFDHLQGKYIWAVMALVRIVGILSLIGFVAIFYFIWRSGRGQSSRKIEARLPGA